MELHQAWKKRDVQTIDFHADFTSDKLEAQNWRNGIFSFQLNEQWGAEHSWDFSGPFPAGQNSSEPSSKPNKPGPAWWGKADTLQKEQFGSQFPQPDSSIWTWHLPCSCSHMCSPRAAAAWARGAGSASHPRNSAYKNMGSQGFSKGPVSKVITGRN